MPSPSRRQQQQPEPEIIYEEEGSKVQTNKENPGNAVPFVIVPYEQQGLDEDEKDEIVGIDV